MPRLLEACSKGGEIDLKVPEVAGSVLKGCFNVLTGCLKVKVQRACKRVYMVLKTMQG